MMRPTLGPTHAIIIPHLDDLERLRTCLHALPESGVEVVVVDNGSDGDLTPLQAQFPWVKFVTEKKRGAGLARNLGVAMSSAPMLVFIDADCVPFGSWWANIIAKGYSDEVIGGAISVFHETQAPLSGPQVLEAAFAFDQRRYVTRKGYAATANLLTSRATFEIVGGFRSGVPEDVDWCHRAAQSGAVLTYASDIEVGHPSRADWPAFVAKWRRLTNEMFCLVRSQRFGRLAWAMRSIAVFASLVVPAVKLVLDNRFSRSEKCRALGALIRLRALRCIWMLRQALFGRSA